MQVTRGSHDFNANADPVMITRGNYQRMEFLGDAILQLVTSDHVYESFPAHHEGHLTVSASPCLVSIMQCS